jgi:hypothetical protein
MAPKFGNVSPDSRQRGKRLDAHSPCQPLHVCSRFRPAHRRAQRIPPFRTHPGSASPRLRTRLPYPQNDRGDINRHWRRHADDSGDRVTSRVVFHFRDGSRDDETTVFTQRGTFRLINDHHIQRGPSFPKPLDVLIDAVTGQITSFSEDGKITREHLDLPPDVSNGLPPNLLLNILPSTSETKLSFVAPTAKPRLISVSIKPAGEVPFSVGGTSRKAVDYVLHVQLGGLAGVIAPIIGKQPPDYHIWILEGAAPAFIREEGQLYEGGPVWRIEQISPTFSR